MRAALVERLGEAPVVRERAEPVRGPGQALIELTAAPINPIDLSIGDGRFYGGVPELPYVPGVEGFGRVLEGDELAGGARVYVEAGGGRGGPGSFAERVSVAESSLVIAPDDSGSLDDALAACLGVAGLAAWLPLEWRAGLREGETVLVLGASGAVGQIAVQAARLLGAGRVLAAARSREGLERAVALGADATVDLSAGGEARAEGRSGAGMAPASEPGVEDLAERLRTAAGGEGIDVTLDPLWGEPAVAAATASRPGGRIVQIGQSAAPEATLSSATVRGSTLSILGYSNFAVPAEVRASAYRRMLSEAAAGRLTVDHDVVPLDEVAGVWERQRSSPRRKLVVRP